MEITPKINHVSGSFDTKEVELLLVPSDKHGEISLCVKDPEGGFNLPVGEIRLYSSNRYVDFKATYNDACNFGNEICRRFNEFPKEGKL